MKAAIDDGMKEETKIMVDTIVDIGDKSTLFIIRIGSCYERVF
jgi:hypothetical protein